MDYTEHKTEKPAKRPAERLTDWADGILLFACCAVLVFLVYHNLGTESNANDALAPLGYGVEFTIPNDFVIADGTTAKDGLQEYARLYRDADGQYYIVAYDPLSTDEMNAVS